MKNIFKNSKRGIAAIFTLCILLGIAGTCVYAASIPEVNTVSTEEKTQELMPMMASACNDYSNILRGKPYVPEGCTRIRNDVASVNSSFFISFVTCTYGSFRANEWKNIWRPGKMMMVTVMNVIIGKVQMV